MLTFGQGTAQNNGGFSLSVIGNGQDSDLVVDLSQPPFSMSLGSLVPQDVIVTSFGGSRGGTVELNPSSPLQLGIFVLPGSTGNPISVDQVVDVAGYLTFKGVTPVLPTVTTISPATGPVLGGTLVTLTGTGFLGATAVKFGSVPATTFTVQSNTQIVATAPPGTAGMVDVTVATPFGTTAVVVGDEFTYA